MRSADGRASLACVTTDPTGSDPAVSTDPSAGSAGPLSGHSVLVAGATGGLGSQIARRLADAGAALTLTARSRAGLDALGLAAATVAADLRTADGAADAVQAAVAAHGGLDGVVFAAGVVAFGPAGEVTDEVLQELFDITVFAPVRLFRAALPALTESAGARRQPFVAHVSAVTAEAPTAGMAAYSAAKAALTAFDNAVSREVRATGIRVLDIRPPHTETGLASRPIAGSAPRLPAGHSPEAVADRIVAAIVGGDRDLPAAAFGSPRG